MTREPRIQTGSGCLNLDPGKPGFPLAAFGFQCGSGAYFHIPVQPDAARGLLRSVACVRKLRHSSPSFAGKDGCGCTKFGHSPVRIVHLIETQAHKFARFLLTLKMEGVKT